MHTILATGNVFIRALVQGNVIQGNLRKKGEFMGLTNGDAQGGGGIRDSDPFALPLLLSCGIRWPSFMEWGSRGMRPETILSLHHLKESAECISSKIISG